MKKKILISLTSIACVLVIANALCAGQTDSSVKVANPTAAAVSPADAGAPQIATSATATASSTVPSSGSTPQLQTRDLRYRVTASDSFDLTFPLSPEYNQAAVTVQPDGFVTLFSVGDVKVQGLTVPELTDAVRNAYGKILHDPIVSIVLKDFNKPFFIADGQVGHPGKYDLREDTTLSQAIAIAGGFTDDAKHSQVILVHRVGSQYVSSQIFDVKKMEAKGDLREDPYVHPGDQILVPKSFSSKAKGWVPSYGMGAYVPLK